MTVIRDSHHQSVAAGPAKITRRHQRERRQSYPWGPFSLLLRDGVRPLFVLGDASACLATAVIVHAGGQSTVGVTLVMAALLALGGLNRSRLSLSVVNLTDEMPPDDPTYTSYPYYDISWFDTEGRSFYLQYTHKFGGGPL